MRIRNVQRVKWVVCPVQVVDAKTGEEVTEESEAAADWVDEYEKFQATETDEWVKELTAAAANAQKVLNAIKP